MRSSFYETPIELKLGRYVREKRPIAKKARRVPKSHGREGGLFFRADSLPSDAVQGAIYEFAAEAPKDFTALASLS
jgi:hypothetical protein